MCSVREDVWLDLIQKLEASFGETPAAKESGSQGVVFSLALLLAYFAAGKPGACVIAVLGVAWLIWTTLRLDWDPEQDLHLVTVQAENLNRLGVIAAAHRNGEQIWEVVDREYPGGDRQVCPASSPRWDGSWERVYNFMLEFRDLSPRDRRARLLQAARRAKVPLLEGEAIAKREDASLASWAADYLFKLRQAKELPQPPSQAW